MTVLSCVRVLSQWTSPGSEWPRRSATARAHHPVPLLVHDDGPGLVSEGLDRAHRGVPEDDFLARGHKGEPGVLHESSDYSCRQH